MSRCECDSFSGTLTREHALRSGRDVAVYDACVIVWTFVGIRHSELVIFIRRSLDMLQREAHEWGIGIFQN